MQRSLLALALASCLALSARAEGVGITVVHTGYLLDAMDNPVNDNALAISFSLWDDISSTDESRRTWQTGATPCTTKVAKGYYAVTLGEGGAGSCGTGLTTELLPFGAARYLEVVIAGATLTPRLRLGSVPTAGVAARALVLASPTSAAAGSVLLADAGGLAKFGTVGSAGITDGAVADADIAPNAAIDTAKISGAVTAIANHGLGALATKTTIADADVATDAAIATSKLFGALAEIPNNGLGALAAKTTIGNGDVAADAGIATSKLFGALTAVSGHGLGALATKTTIGNGDVAADAGITTSKLSGALTAVSGHGLGALAAKTTIGNGDVAADAGITTSKLSGALTAVVGHGLGALAAKTTIVNADVATSAAIAGSKIAPDFGTQNILTTGKLGIGVAAPAEMVEVAGNVKATRFNGSGAGLTNLPPSESSASGQYVKLYTQDHSTVPLNPHINFCATTGNVIGCASFEAVGSSHNNNWPYSAGPKAVIRQTGNAVLRFWASGFDVYVSSSYSLTWRFLSNYAIAPQVVSAIPSGATEFGNL